MLVVVATVHKHADLGTPLVLNLQDAKSSDAELYTFLAGKKPLRLVILGTNLLKDLHSAILRAIKVTAAHRFADSNASVCTTSSGFAAQEAPGIAQNILKHVIRRAGQCRHLLTAKAVNTEGWLASRHTPRWQAVSS